MANSSVRQRVVAALLGILLLAAACSSGNQAANNSSSSQSEVDRLLDEGVALQNSGDLNGALQKYVDVTKKDPNNKIAFYDIGVVYGLQNNINEARTAYEKAIQLDGAFPSALFNLAILETAGNPGRAETLYRQLLTINPSDPNVQFNLGLLVKQQGRTEEGNALIQQAVQTNPELASRIPPDSTESSSSS